MTLENLLGPGPWPRRVATAALFLLPALALTVQSGYSYGAELLLVEAVAPPIDAYPSIASMSSSTVLGALHEQAARSLGSPRVLNTVLLGMAARSGALGLTEEDLLSAMPSVLPGRFLELNRKAFYFTSQHSS